MTVLLERTESTTTVPTTAVPSTEAISYAFFDVDETLISLKSMLSFQDYWYEQTADEAGRLCYQQDMHRYLSKGVSREFLNRLYYRHFAGRDPEQVVELARRWLSHNKHLNPAFYHPKPLAELRAHQRQGSPVVFVSGSFPALLEPIAEDLGVADVLATQLEVVAGRYSGELIPPQTIGEGKATAIRAFLSQRGVEPGRCFAYGDDVSDLPMLYTVGQPTVVSGSRELEARAKALDWRVIARV